MKMLVPATIMFALLTACSSPSGDSSAPVATQSSTPATTPEPAATMPMPEAPEKAATTASASGTIEAVDASAKTVTIAHGPVEALKWPAMTMTFKAGSVDISGLKVGEQVDFEFASTGMEGTLTKIRAQ